MCRRERWISTRASVLNQARHMNNKDTFPTRPRETPVFEDPTRNMEIVTLNFAVYRAKTVHPYRHSSYRTRVGRRKGFN